MSKYEQYDYRPQERPPLMPGEQILWQAKPKKNAFVINKAMAMMPIALIWLLFDGFFIVTMLSTGEMGGAGFFLVPFFALHLMPVWIWLYNVLTANKHWQNTVYYITDKRILIQRGFASKELETIYYKDIRNVNLKISIIDQMLGVGDIHFDVGLYSQKNRPLTKAFLDVAEPHQVYNRVQQIVMDIQTDIEYPNAYRPEENPGYQTRYRG